MSGGKRLVRIEKRPDPASWDPDELMSLAEAVALFFKDGPLKLSGLRTAARDGDLAVRRIAGKMLTTKASVMAMGRCRIEEPAAPPPALPPKPLSAAEARGLLAE